MVSKAERKSSVRSLKMMFRGIELLVIQCSVCVIVLLVALIFKWIGGDVYARLSSEFCRAMLENTVFNAVAASSDTEIVCVSGKSLSSSSDNTLRVPPLEVGILTSAYGERRDPFTGELSFHEGIDIATEQGTPIVAVQSGSVTTKEYDENGYGHYVVITCESGDKYVYAHCESINVNIGETVKAGQTVAFVGNSGRSTGAHLHFEWLINNQTVDPLTVFPELSYV